MSQQAIHPNVAPSTIIEPSSSPPQEPPPGVTAELLWRVAARLFDDHSVNPARRCRRCRQPWPCSGRRLAELGLNAARG